MAIESSPCQIGQIAFTVDDVERAIAFYRDKVGLKHLFSAPPALAFFACDNVRLMLSKPESEDGERFRGAVYFKVKDIQATRDELAARGIQFEAEPRMIAKMPDHELWMAFLRDTEKNMIGLMAEVR